MATPAATPATTESTTLYFGPWYRRSPFFEKTLEAGCSAYDIYNHMYLPGYYADPIEEYWALLNDVTVWDVSVERIVEITGPDASAFTNSLTCRDLTKCAVGQGKYMLVTAEDGGIVNDPVLLRIEEDRWWMALADSDAGLWARGVAIHSRLDVKVREPEVYPIQVQGPKSRDTLRTVFGPAIDDIKYYWTLTTEVDGIPVVISRTGWTGEVGYEIYLRDPARGGDLWDRVMEAGKPHGIRPIAPCEARRIEAGIFNYGSDITIADTPFHVMGLERLVETQDADYIGKAALEEIRRTGVDRKLIAYPRIRGQLVDFATATLARDAGFEQFDVVAGGETAGIPYAAWIADRLGLPMQYIRKKPKGFGRNAQIEGDVREGARTLLVEDLTTDGRSKINFCKALREAGAVVEHVFVNFYYDIFPDSKKVMGELGVRLHHLATWWDVLEVVKQGNYLAGAQVAEVEKFLNAPAEWSAAHGGASSFGAS